MENSLAGEGATVFGLDYCAVGMVFDYHRAVVVGHMQLPGIEIQLAILEVGFVACGGRITRLEVAELSLYRYSGYLGSWR